MARREDLVVTRLNVKEIFGSPGLPEDTIGIGEDDNGTDFKLYGATSGSYALWDESADTMVFEGADLRLNDSDYLVFGDDSDARMTWNGTYMEGPAPASGFWAGCPCNAYSDPLLSFEFFEDFIGIPLDTNNEPAFGWFWYENTNGGATFAIAAGTTGGEATMTTHGNDNDDCGLQLGHAATDTYVEFVKDSGKKLWAEFRVKISASGNNQTIFIGLAEQGVNASVFIADAGNDFADKDLIGFVVWETAGLVVDINHQKSGGVLVDVGEGLADHTDTYHTYGIYFDGVETITFYVDGTAFGTTVDLDTATCPTGEELSPIVYIKTHSEATKALVIDWIKIVQQR